MLNEKKKRDGLKQKKYARDFSCRLSVDARGACQKLAVVECFNFCQRADLKLLHSFTISVLPFTGGKANKGIFNLFDQGWSHFHCGCIHWERGIPGTCHT